MVDYQLGVDSAIVLNYGTADEAVVKGLNKLGPPGIKRGILTVDEFRNDFARQFTSGGEYTPITYGGNFTTGDEKGQELLKQHLVDKTKLVGTDFMAFIDYNHFFTTDLANDADSGIQIAEHLPGEADKNGIYELSGQAVPNGRLALYTAHMVEGATPTLAFVSGSPDTITDSGSGFITAGFKVGMTLLIINSTSNDPVAALITAVAAGQLDLEVKIGTLASEAGIEGMEIHGGAV